MKLKSLLQETKVWKESLVNHYHLKTQRKLN